MWVWIYRSLPLFLVSFLTLLPANGINGSNDGLMIPIGAIFDTDDEQARTAFHYAQHTYNARITNPFMLAYFRDNVDVKDSFKMASAICSMMSKGVFLFYGGKDVLSEDIIHSFTKKLHMPYLSPSTSLTFTEDQPGYEVRMKPDHSYAFIDMILWYGWTRVHYLYDSDEGLQRIQLVLNILHNITSTKGFPFHVNVVARRLHNVQRAHDELRQMDRILPENMEKVIVFDLSTEVAYKQILRQIPEVGMNKAGYNYLFGTLDFANMDWSRYLHGGVNVTGFQLLDYNSNHLKKFMNAWNGLNTLTFPGAGTKLTYESALAVDAIEVITRSLKRMITSNPKIFQATFRRKQLYNFNKTRGIPCVKPYIPWMHGDAIMSEIKKLDFEGLTGKVRFDDLGYRRDYKLGVFKVGLDEGPEKIGNWTPEEGFLSLNPVLLPHENVTLGDAPKKITTILSPPFLMKSESPDPQTGIPLVGNDRYHGYAKDLAYEVGQILKFDFILELVPDGEYGVNTGGEKWTGMIGVLYRKEADLSVAPLTITWDREVAVDFTKPFMDVGISIMIKKPEITKPGVFSFMEPLSEQIWLCILVAYACVSVGLFLVSRFSPFEWQPTQTKGEFSNHFNILNAFWFSMGALMLQGSDACPKSFSGRIIGTVWWFFVLIIISSYTANLAAFLTIEQMHTPIESADDLAKQTEIKYGTINSGTSKLFFNTSKVPTYEKMWNFMVSERPSVFVNTIEEGVEKVRKSKGKYAFLLESSTNEYINNRAPCDTMKVGLNLNNKGFGIATPEGSPLRSPVNLAVLQLKEDGTLHKLKTKWWKDKGQCSGTDGKDSSKKRELSLSNVAGIFYILVGGLVLAVILASIEFICDKSKFFEKNPSYLRATDTAITLVGTPTEKENGGFSDFASSNHAEKEESTFSYGPVPAIGFEHFSGHDNTDL